MKGAFLGVDFATQSARATLIDETGALLSNAKEDLAPVLRGGDGRLTQDPASWLVAIDQLLNISIARAGQLGYQIAGLTITATSGTFLLADAQGAPLAPAAMYNDGRASNPLARAEKILAEVSATTSRLAHTPEFLIAHLTQQPLEEVATDWSHAMKSGVDLNIKNWSAESCTIAEKLAIALPQVVAPGTQLGRTKVGAIPIYAGMTDGCTAQISVGGTSPGTAVSTLGTTLVLKVVAPTEVKGPGFYSHLLPESRWLGGAASNLGGISYAKFADDIESWNLRASENGPASVLMYPLVGVGERFPVAASQMAALQSGQPKDEVDEFRAILEAIAFAERLAYETLATAGAPSDKTLYSVGGGSRSAFWSQLRATISNRAITTVDEAGSDLGAAKIAAAAARGGDLASNLDSFNSSISKVYLPQVNQVSFYEERYQEFLALISPFQSAGIR